jgi:GNAT superfamily N-acetyltransferase
MMNHRSYLLELSSRREFRARSFPQPGISISQAKPHEADRCRRLWTEVGSGFWSEREEWSGAQWAQYLNDPRVAFWIAACGSEDIGFYELTTLGEETKIEGFGLLPSWRSHGFGGGLLSAATQCAFDRGASRIWLHTATDDHPNALPNYQKRGYQIYREENLENPMPTASSANAAERHR